MCNSVFFTIRCWSKGDLVLRVTCKHLQHKAPHLPRFYWHCISFGSSLHKLRGNKMWWRWWFLILKKITNDWNSWLNFLASPLLEVKPALGRIWTPSLRRCFIFYSLMFICKWNSLWTCSYLMTNNQSCDPPMPEKFRCLMHFYEVFGIYEWILR